MSKAITAIGADTNYYDHNKAHAFDLIRVEPKSVFEIGCAKGSLLRRILDSGANRVVGVEYVDDIAAIARKRCPEAKIIAGDIEAIDSSDLGSDYDLVIANHVLEHLVNPDRVLQKLYGMLRTGGQFIGALPNIRHWSIARDVFFRGRWDYADEGILDRTHLRFFARKNIYELFQNAGFTKIEIIPDFGEGRASNLNKLTMGVIEDNLAFAFNISAWK